MRILYSIASLSKILLNVAIYRLITGGEYKAVGLSWDKSVCDLFNELRRRHGKPLIRRPSRDPSLIELLLHRNGFAPMNEYLIAPDGTFIMSEDEFLEVAPRLTEDYFTGSRQNMDEYSNADHIIAGLLLQELTGRKLSQVMQEAVFNPLGMSYTVMDEASLQKLEAEGAIVAAGHRVSGDRRRIDRLPERKYLDDTVEVASLGVWSCTEDLAKLIGEFLRALDHLNTKFEKEDTLRFFGLSSNHGDGIRTSLGGMICPLDSIFAGNESTNRILSPTDQFPPYTLGRHPDGDPCEVYYKAGAVDGFASALYISLDERTFVIVLANSSGPLDVTDHIARYVLQEAFNLSPRVDVVTKAIEEGTRSSTRLQDLERADEDTLNWSENVDDFAGTYQHVRYGQKLEITPAGDVILRGKSKSSSPMKARVSGNTMRIFPGPEGFGIERWTVWDNRDFTLENRRGKAVLMGNAPHDRYEKL